MRGPHRSRSAAASTGVATVVQLARAPAQPSSSRVDRTASTGVAAPAVAAAPARAASITAAVAAPAAAPSLPAAATSSASAAAAPLPRVPTTLPLSSVIDLSLPDAVADSAPLSDAGAASAAAAAAAPTATQAFSADASSTTQAPNAAARWLHLRLLQQLLCLSHWRFPMIHLTCHFPMQLPPPEAGEVRGAARRAKRNEYFKRIGIVTAENYYPRSPAAASRRADNLDRGRANLSDGDTD
jgi:hypothetical protein